MKRSEEKTYRNMKKLMLSALCVLMLLPLHAALEVGKTYRIAPEGSGGKSLFVSNASVADRQAVVVWTETDVPAQQWTVTRLSGKTVVLKNVYSGKYLNAPSRRLEQTTAQIPWTLEAADEATDSYRLKLGSYLTLSATADGTQPALGNTAQVWRFTEVEARPLFDAQARSRMLDGFLEQYLQDKGNGYSTFVGGSWGEAETLETILDCYEGTGEQRFADIFASCYRYMRYHVGNRWNGGTVVGGYDWFGYDFNDDVMWMIIAAARAYHLTQQQSYLTDAQRNFDLIWQRAYLGYVGLLRWAEHTGDRNSANSCINGPAAVAACYIGAGLGDETYFEKARELYANQRTYLFEPATGHVYDNVIFNPDDGSVVSRNTWASTYNQGTMLGAAMLLYRHYGDEQYLTDAKRIIAYARKNLCGADGVVSVCQNADGDFQGFKGILMRYAGLYARLQNDQDYQAWVRANAFRAYNNLNSRSFGHSAWLTKASEDLMYGEVNYGLSSSAFGASAALSAACCVPVEGGEQADVSLPPAHRSAPADNDRLYNLGGWPITTPLLGSIYIRNGQKYIATR